MRMSWRWVLGWGLLLITQLSWAQTASLNIYIWGNYLPPEIIRQFTRETGIKVNLAEYDNNETMFTKVRLLKNAGYDIVVPSSYFVERMRKLGMLEPLNRKWLPNFCHLSPILLNHLFDPANVYSVPYFWGSVGIIVNQKYVDGREVAAWQDFWNYRYRGKLMLLDDMRDVFSVALLALGYSINETDPQHIHEAYLKLKQLLPNVKLFNIDTVPNIYVDEDALIGMAWGGDAKLAQEENQHLKYIYPREGFTIWIDNFAILKGAPHVKEAHQFINFMLRPEVAKQVSLILGYSTANTSALQLMPPKVKGHAIDNLNSPIIRRGQVQLDLEPAVRQLYEKYWERLKIGN